MPPIVSTLEADFSDFVAETQKANLALSDMQKEADQTSAAVERSSVVVGKFGSAAGQSATGFSTLSTGLRTADKTLGAFGMQIGPQISAIEEMGQVAGKTATEIGKIGTAASIAGAALAGWSIGRKIAELTGADAAIADLASTIMGWGSASTEAALAQNDLISRAREFGYYGNNAAEAAKVVTKAVKEQQEVFNTGATRVKDWTTQLNRAAADGLPGLRAEIEAGNSTVAQMAQHYKVSAGAVQYLQRQMQDEAAARKIAVAEMKAQAEALIEVNEAITGQSAVLDSLTDAQREAAEAALAAGVSQATVAKAYELTVPQVRAVADAMKEYEDAIKAFDKAQKIASDANADWNSELMARSSTTTQKLIDDVERWRTETIAALDETGGATAAHYAQIEGIANEQLAKIRVDWDVLKEGAIATYADMAARAEATYQEMLAHSSAYTAGAIEQAKLVRDETLATFEQMSASHDATYAEFLKRDKAYADALKQFRDEAAGEQEAAYQKQTAALDRAIAYSQAYGVTLDEANKRLAEMGNAGESAGQRTGAAMQGAAQQVQGLAAIVAQTSSQLDALAQHYDQIAEQTMQGGGTGLGWSPAQVAENYRQSAQDARERAGRTRYYENQIGGQAWGNRGMTSTANTLNVNVNNAEAGDIANRLVTELRHAGVRLG